MTIIEKISAGFDQGFTLNSVKMLSLILICYNSVFTYSLDRVFMNLYDCGAQNKLFWRKG